MSIRKIVDGNPAFLFIARFLLLFFFGYLLLPFFRGLTGTGGFFYSSFFDHHLNLVKGFTGFLTTLAKWTLEFFDYDVRQRDYHILRIGYSRGIVVNPSCLGWAVMSFWAAFVMANPGKLKNKASWAITGLVLIILLNVCRIVMIILANHLNWSSITSLDHHQTFNICSYGFILLLIFFYVKSQKNFEQRRSVHGERSNTAGTVQQRLV